MKLLKFDYVNWRGDRHEYVIDPTGIELMEGDHTESHVAGHWCVHGHVVTRDGSPRPEMGPTRRRTFILVNIENMEEVERSR